MRHIHGTDQIDLQHTRPVAGFQIPKGKPKFSRTCADRKHHVIHLGHALGKSLHLLITGDITSHHGLCAGDRLSPGIPVKSPDTTLLTDKARSDGPADAIACAENCD